MRNFRIGDMIKASRDTDGGTPQLFIGKKYKITRLYQNRDGTVYGYGIVNEKGEDGGWTLENFCMDDDACGECKGSCRRIEGKCEFYEV